MPSIAERLRSVVAAILPPQMPAEQEAAFARYCHERFCRLADVFAASAVLCSIVWWQLDRVVYRSLPEYIGPAAIWRSVVVGIAAAYLLVSRLNVVRNHVEALLVAGFSGVCVTLGAASGPLGGPESAQFHMLYVLGFGTVLLPVRLGPRIAMTVFFCAMIVLGCIGFYPELRASNKLPMAISFYAWVTAMSVTFGHLTFLLLRSNFFQAVLLADNNATLEQRVLERTYELRGLLARLDATREEERSRIAREVHDQLGQELLAQRLTLAVAADCFDTEPEVTRKKLAEMRTLHEGMMATVRALIADLRPWILHDLGLAEAARWLARRTEDLAGIRCTLFVVGDPTSVGAERSAAVFRMLQESLTNVTKHAHATAVTIHLERSESDLVLRVQDDGVGPGGGTEKKGFGLLGMHERAQALGGEFSLVGPPTGGTLITCRLPIDDQGSAS